MWGCQPEHCAAGMGEQEREVTYSEHFYDSSFLFQGAGEVEVRLLPPNTARKTNRRFPN